MLHVGWGRGVIIACRSRRRATTITRLDLLSRLQRNKQLSACVQCSRTLPGNTKNQKRGSESIHPSIPSIPRFGFLSRVSRCGQATVVLVEPTTSTPAKVINWPEARWWQRCPSFRGP
mmetsp:Transcript_20087/g.41639  ORF Transcript_20087/g.41639 Transcript_20087/m.41639 type:complete len:118 (-) Transcript_20087:12-365(-)